MNWRNNIERGTEGSTDNYNDHYLSYEIAVSEVCKYDFVK